MRIVNQAVEDTVGQRGIADRLVDGNGHGWFSDFGSGLYDSIVGPIVQTVAHPINTAVVLVNAAIHPINTAIAVGSAAVATVKAAASGDGKAVGQVVGTVVSAVATAGAGKLAASAIKGAEVAETAGQVATRAITSLKLNSWRDRIRSCKSNFKNDPK